MRFVSFIFFFLLFFSSFGGNPREHIYNKSRLKVLSDSITLCGIITSIHPEIDGDYHLHLRIKETNLLAKRNFIDEDGCLVLEIICGKGSVFTICNKYENKIPLPKVGDYVQVSGVYVFDKVHRINEIHPVLEMNIINEIVEK